MTSSNRRFQVLLAVAGIGAWLFFEYPGTALRWMLSEVVVPEFYESVSDDRGGGRLFYFRAFAALAAVYLLYELGRWLLPEATAESSVRTSAPSIDRSTPAGKVASLAKQLRPGTLAVSLVLNRDRARKAGYAPKPHSIWVYSEIGVNSHRSGPQHDFSQQQMTEFLGEAERLHELAENDHEVADRLALLRQIGIGVEHKTYAHAREAGYFVQLSDYENSIEQILQLAANEAGYDDAFARALASIRFRLWMKRQYSANHRLWRTLIPFKLENPY